METKSSYVLITGATSGFGYEFATLFAENKRNLILVARLEDRLQEVADELSSRFQVHIVPLAADLFDPSAPLYIYNEVLAQSLNVDVLVNNAGQGEHGKFASTDLQRELDLIQLNVIAPVCLTKYFLKEMLRQKHGRILQVSSVLGKQPSPLMAVYAGTKAFIYNFSQSVINELENSDVTMTVLLPGASDTDFFHKAHAEDSKTYREGNLADPAQVARDGYDALMSGESRIISGFKNKVQVTMSNVITDSQVAANVRKQMEESDEDYGRVTSEHLPSAEERERLGEGNR